MSRYELLERIGVGGMAEVFRGRATAVGGFEKPVAIKKILPHLSQDNRFVALLIAEAKLLSHLRQRNIVQIYDVGLGEDGGYFLVMEFVDGHDVGALFERMEKKRERFPLDLALHIGSEVCEALEHAHKATDSNGNVLSLVHRDVSPSNIMLSNSGEVKLTDFGIAKKIDQQSAVQNIAGKFAYMSPEQASGKPVGPGSDQYSLAVVIWELLLGRRMYKGLPEVEALKLVRDARVQRPREIDPSFSRELEAILMKAMSPDPQKRYPNASAFGAALRDYRYSAATAGDPAREIQILLRRYFSDRGASDRGRAPDEPSRVLKIQTVAGFDGPEGGADPASSPARRIFDTFDAPTVAADSLRPPPATVSQRPAGLDARPSGNGSARGTGGLPSFDHGDDDETRMLETRRGRKLPLPDDGPTTAASPPPPRAREGGARGTGNPVPVADAPASSSPAKTAAGKRAAPRPSAPPAATSASSSALPLPAAAATASPEPKVPGVAAVTAPVPVRPARPAPVPARATLSPPSERRKLWIGGLVALLVLGGGAFAILRVLGHGGAATTRPSGPLTPAAQPATGEALEGPAIQAPVKKQKKPREP